MKFEVDIDDDLFLELQKRAQELDLVVNDYVIYLLKREHITE